MLSAEIFFLTLIVMFGFAFFFPNPFIYLFKYFFYYALKCMINVFIDAQFVIFRITFWESVGIFDIRLIHISQGYNLQ